MTDQSGNENSNGRIGRLMEDMDLLAGAIAYKHCRNCCSVDNPLTIVTASVDGIELLQPLFSDMDIRLHGSVVHVGNSSMQVLIRMEKFDASIGSLDPGGAVEATSLGLKSSWLQQPAVKDLLLAEAKFTMVARDAEHKAFEVPKLTIRNKVEESLFEMGEKERLERQAAKAISVEKMAPSQEESALIHRIFLFTKNKTELPADYIWMENTHLESTRICHPQVTVAHEGTQYSQFHVWRLSDEGGI